MDEGSDNDSVEFSGSPGLKTNEDDRETPPNFPGREPAQFSPIRNPELLEIMKRYGLGSGRLDDPQEVEEESETDEKLRSKSEIHL